MAMARCTRRPLILFASASSFSLAGSRSTKRWKLPSPTCPTRGAGRKVWLRSSAVWRMHSASRDIGTHTSVVHTSAPGFKAPAAQNASLRALHMLCFSSGVFVQARSLPPCFFARSFTIPMISSTALGLPLNSKNRCGFRGRLKFAWMFTACTIAESSNSTLPTWHPLCMICITHFEASSTELKFATATDDIAGMRCSFKVASVTSPRVPSDPMKRRVRS
mmetsp:Transcript_19769/g.34000  ORF Transcript_19769/g.34000 Transcript_19769/m.34000 type:complete len:220 (-) Transcript_19769:869-1528(-)